MEQARRLVEQEEVALMFGSLINTGPTDCRVIEHMKLQRFSGTVWDLI